MNVELAEERILSIQDRFTMDHAEGRAWTKRIEAFGALAKVSGFLSKPRDEDFQLVYRERRLQPFWRVVCTAAYAYERARSYVVKVEPQVREVEICGETRAVANQEFTLQGRETCREEIRRETLYDGLTKAAASGLAAYLKYDASVIAPEALAEAAAEGTIVVPPTAKSSELVREALSGVITRIDADRVLEESLRLEAADLYYRPVYAFRYAWQGKEAVVEFDGLTGETRAGGATFEQHFGKLLEPRFLLDVGVETASLFVPGAKVAQMVVEKGIAIALTHQTR